MSADPFMEGEDEKMVLYLIYPCCFRGLTAIQIRIILSVYPSRLHPPDNVPVRISIVLCGVL